MEVLMCIGLWLAQASTPDEVMDIGKRNSSAPEPPRKKKGQDPLQEEGPQRPVTFPDAAQSPDPDGMKVRIKAGLELEYNSNILRLDDEEIDQLESGSRPDKFRIDEPDDFIYNPWAELSLQFRLFEAPSTGGLRLGGHFHQTNSIANYEEIGLFFRHSPFDLEYTFLPDVYRREYRDLDTNQFESAFYAEHDVQTSVRFKLHPQLTLRPVAGLRFRDFESPFNHRDSLALTLGLRPRWQLTPWLDFIGEYEFVLNDAYANSTQPDTSYREIGIQPGVAVKPTKDIEVTLRYRIGLRDYTTGNSPGVDPGHRDREDDRRQLRLGVGWDVTKALTLKVEYRWTHVQSDTPHDAGATSEETSWDRDEFILGATYAF